MTDPANDHECCATCRLWLQDHLGNEAWGWCQSKGGIGSWRGHKKHKADTATGPMTHAEGLCEDFSPDCSSGSLPLSGAD